MSEVFDPEKVERWETVNGLPMQSSMGDESPDPKFVRAADYDKLLALYREARRQLEIEWRTEYALNSSAAQDRT